jgi:hypothetical protein
VKCLQGCNSPDRVLLPNIALNCGLLLARRAFGAALSGFAFAGRLVCEP